MTSLEFTAALNRVCAGAPDLGGLQLLLGATDEAEIQALHAAAYEVKTREVGRVARLRGLIELSNVCTRNCRYCGIRRDNTDVERYTLPVGEIVQAAGNALEFGYGSIVLQGGERQDDRHTDYITDLLEKIHASTGGELGVTLSVGEQDRTVLRRWRQAGAHRYLLRMETSDQKLYADLHPDHPDWEKRRRNLDDLRTEGYQVGTGVMIGLPGQTRASLARDLLFFRRQDVDMLGMGPFIPHADTPMAGQQVGFDADEQVRLALNMIACARLLLPDANIASTTALQALHPRGRERGLLAGGNVMMPNVTGLRYRAAYQLYNGKPSLDEDAESCRRALEKSVAAIGETIGYNERGDAPRALARLPRD